MTDRDRKILLFLVPVVLLGAVWFLAIKPKRQEAATVGKQLTEQVKKRDAAVARAGGLERAKTNFAADYGEVIRLGKAIPATIDVPSLIVQLDEAAKGSRIEFNSIRTGERDPAAPTPALATPPPAGGSQPPPAGGAQPAAGGATPPGGGAAPGGAQPAASAPGQTAQNATGAVNTANAQNGQNAAAAGSPPGGAPAGAPGGAGGGAVPGLDTVPLEFSFEGDFFQLADLFHRLKRFVRVDGEQLVVRGRLMTIDSFTFDSAESFPKLTAEVKATVYLAPKAEGTSAGASPSGPPQAAGAPAAPQPASAPSAAPATATATP